MLGGFDLAPSRVSLALRDNRSPPSKTECERSTDYQDDIPNCLKGGHFTRSLGMYGFAKSQGGGESCYPYCEKANGEPKRNGLVT